MGRLYNVVDPILWEKTIVVFIVMKDEDLALNGFNFQVIAVGYAIMTTRSMDMNWKMRAIRVLPMFLLPALSSAAYSTFVSFTRMCKCQKVYS